MIEKAELSEQVGFTLIEMMVTLLVIAVLLVIGVPSLKKMTINRHADKLAQELQIDIMYARNQALSSAKDITIEPNGQWNEGWLIKEGTALLRISNPRAKAGEIASSATVIEFNKFGRLTSGNTEIKVAVNDCTGNRIRTIKINALGQIVTKVDPC